MATTVVANIEYRYIQLRCVTAQVRDLLRMGIPLPNSDYKTYTYNEI